jgi:hypothetical protein
MHLEWAMAHRFLLLLTALVLAGCAVPWRRPLITDQAPVFVERSRVESALAREGWCDLRHWPEHTTATSCDERDRMSLNLGFHHGRLVNAQVRVAVPVVRIMGPHHSRQRRQLQRDQAEEVYDRLRDELDIRYGKPFFEQKYRATWRASRVERVDLEVSADATSVVETHIFDSRVIEPSGTLVARP